MIKIKNRYTGEIIKTVDAENLNNSYLRRADLIEANLRRADLGGAYLSGTNLSGADLRGAYLSGADLSMANLRGANLSEANLRRADLRRADLSDADLSGADLGGAYLRGADLSGADLRGADLSLASFDAPVFRLDSGVYSVSFNWTHLQIGCKKYTPNEWDSFEDNEISRMDGKALAFWREHKEPLLMLCRNLLRSRGAK